MKTDMYTSESGGRSISQILHDIVNHLSEIIRSEVLLAKTEVRQDVTYAARASVLLVVGAIFSLYAVGFLLLGLVYALAGNLSPWLSAIIVAAGTGVVAGVLLLIGRSRIKQAKLKPDKTIRSLQENVTWFKKQTR
jgi:uncharacterized membrane protein YuzA (DUF378 family)